MRNFLWLTAVASAQLYVGFPIAQQLPDVARTDQAYSFTFSSQTYKSWAGGNIQYSASNYPTWMNFDSTSRTFSGVPTKNDVGQFTVTVSGVDSADQTSISTNYTMVVSNATGLHLSSADAMFVQISKYGQTNGNDGLVLKQGDEFSIQFDKNVFESYSNSTRPIIAYYGRSQDRSSLPNWIHFDGDTCTFSGTVPYVTSDVAPSIEYSFAFIASDYYGFSGAEGEFKIVVGAHQLSTSVNQTIKVNGTYGSDFSIDVPIFTEVYLDGKPISAENISSVYTNDLPSFASFDNSKYVLSGTFPDDYTFDNLTVSLKDVYGNIVEIPFSLKSLDSVFTMNLPDVNCTRGTWFSYQLLDSYFTDVKDTTLSVDFTAPWLTYHENNKTFQGEVPKDLDTVAVSITASSSFDKETKEFTIRGDGSASSKPSSTSTHSSKPSSTASSTSVTSSTSAASATSTATPAHNNSKKLAIGLGVGIPVACIAVALIILLCCLKRRKDKDQEKNSPVISGPVHLEPKEVTVTAVPVKEVNEKNKDSFDVCSASSSVTHVDGEPSFYDADEKPIKSWRANDRSDKNRQSEVSMSTVNTDNLFSVRLVDDNRASAESDLYSGQIFSMSRSSSGNVQRLDSDGNIVGTVHHHNSLDAVTEENSRDYSGSAMGAFGNYHFNDETDTSSNDLLRKLSDSANPSNSNSERDLYHLRNSPPDGDFCATNVDGEFKWEGVVSRMTPVQEHFYNDSTPFSAISVHSQSTEVGSKAKLIDFTRKGSLRESVHDHNFDLDGQTASPSMVNE